MSHPTSGLLETVHQRARLGILAVLHETPRAEFGFLDKGYEGRRARTWIRITKAGRNALAEEIGNLKELIRRVESPAGATPAAGPAESAEG